MSQKISEIKYPQDFYLWKREIISERDKLQIIGGFPHCERILAGIGLNDSKLRNSFGITDKQEIIARQSLLWYLVKNEELREWLKDIIVKSGLPDEQHAFLSFFDHTKEHNPYWAQVRQFIKLCDQLRPMPERLNGLVEFLQDSLLLETEEKEMSDDLFQRIENVAFIEGIMDFVWSCGWGNPNFVENSDHIFGYHIFSSKLDYWRNRFGKSEHNLLVRGMRYFARKYANRQRKIVVEKLVIGSGLEIIEDVKRAVGSILSKYQIMNQTADEAIVKVFFRYGKDGLKVQIYGMEHAREGYKEPFLCNYYEGYPEKFQREIKAAEAEYTKVYSDFHRKMGIARLLSRIEETNPFFLQETHSCASPQMDGMYKWVNLKSMYQNEFSGVIKRLEKHRRFFTDQMMCLKDIVFIANAFCATSERYNLPLCKPIISQEHVIAFEEIYPAYLLSKVGKEIKSFKNMPEINGNVVGMSGVHEGGKTTIGLTLNEAIYLAQSGLLCFGNEVSTNVKKVLGMIFVPPGSEGSLCVQLLDQIKELLEIIRQSKNCDVFVTIDELGGGTQVSDGQEFGARLIRTLQSYRVSTYFNSQITPLFQLLEEEGVVCLQVNSDHAISPGIGTGRFQELMKRKGIDKMLEK